MGDVHALYKLSSHLLDQVCAVKSLEGEDGKENVTLNNLGLFCKHWRPNNLMSNT